MSKELYPEGLKHLSSILLKAQGRPDAETQSDIDIGYECMRLRVVLDSMNVHPPKPAAQPQHAVVMCDCLNFCGDDPDVQKGKVEPCEHKKRSEALKAEAAQQKGIVEKYNELLYHVARKFPNESRHETALRYIKNAESAEAACSAAKEEGKNV